jgi:serine/threonine protein kinase
MSLQLQVIAGPDVGRVFTIQDSTDSLLGRGANCLYRLNDPRVSRSHAFIKLEGERATIEDNGGSGGVIVNGAPIKSHVLKLGDVIQIGDTQVRVQMGDFPLNVALAALAGSPTMPNPTPPNPDELQSLSDTTLGHYEIGPVIGKGRIGMVFHATDTKDQRPVALKVLLREFSKNDEEMQRFIRGMKTTMPLKHPNLVSLYGAGKTNGYCWIAMEFIAGENYKQIIDRLGVAGTIDWKHAYRPAVHVARALAYAHGEGIIHRNLTPTNILRDVPHNVVKLGDLMLAKALEGTASEVITRPGELVGEVEYMSPERTRGTNEIDARSDLYGLGAFTYALLTGKPPCTGKTLVEKVTRIRQVDPEKPTKSQMSIPSAFEGVVMKLLAKDPKNRFQTAQEVVHELERVGRYNGVSA